ncbi:MAG TPA: two-component regulator propeller domain-containing protein, partial [Chitinophagaceae bacterium]|nr:two-component regulator propeller domain-containing protein [Chitinophagaceae bacterium]
MKLFTRNFTFIFLFVFLKESIAQTAEVKFNLITGSNGISLGKINGMARDIHGVMWFSDQTNRCIVSYDGNRMTRYQNDPKKTNSLGGYYPECLYADSSGSIWIGFYGMGLDRFDPETNTFTHYRHNANDPESLSSDSVTAVLVDHLGKIWVGSYGGVDLLDPKTGKFKHYKHTQDPSSLSSRMVRALYEDREGTLWVGTGFVWDSDSTNGGLNRFDRKTGTFTRYLNDPKNPHSLINNKVRAIFEDSKGNLWIGTKGDGLHTMDRKTGTFERYLYTHSKPDQLARPPLKSSDDHITFITEDAKQNLWIGTFSNGLIWYDPLTKKMTHYGNNADGSGNFKDNSGWWAHASADGLLWVSTQEASLYKIDLFTNTIPRYDYDSGIIVNTVYEEPGVAYWFGTDNSGLVRKDIKNGSIQRFIPGIDFVANSIGNIMKDQEGYFWIGTRGGLKRFNPKTHLFTHYQYDAGNNESISNNRVFDICEDGEFLWVSTEGGLNKLNRKNGKFTRYIYDPADSNSLSHDITTALLKDETNDLWIGTWNNGGLNRMYHETKKFKRYLEGQSVIQIFKDPDRVIWVLTTAGIQRYNRKEDDFYPFTEENTGIAMENVWSLVADNANNLWLTSSLGIYRLNKERNQAVLFGKESGVIGEEVRYSWITKMSDGKIYIPGYYGYYSFDPGKLNANSVLPKIYFSNFWLNSKDIKPGDNSPLREPLFTAKEINLQYDQNVFSVSFTSVDFSNSADKRIYYMLENYDKNWRQSNTENRVYYFKVPPGKYVFRIKAVNSNNGTWVEKNITIHISSPWWTRWWAYFIYGLLFILLAISVHRYQKNRLLKAERERARVRELAQAKEIEKAYHKLKTTQQQLIQSEKMASLGELTAGIAHEIQNPLNFVNNFSEVNNELIEEIKSQKLKLKSEELDDLLNDIFHNNEKINHHGKRADAIVKGMLQHSRSSNGLKEPTDINALAYEYLRLSYHGLRAKDKSLNAKFETEFDNSIGKVNIIPQDVGRVILNLINNAFYAVTDRRKLSENGYEPIVSVSTKKTNDKIEINVKDNGTGIPQKVLDKIFQPFFTTKPTGQGTGLGLSLS